MNFTVTKTAFGESSEPVIVTEFEYPAEDHAPPGVEADHSGVLRMVLILLMEGGKANAAAVGARTGALARLIGLYETDSKVATRLRVDPTTVLRAKQLMGLRLSKALLKEPHRNFKKSQPTPPHTNEIR